MDKIPLMGFTRGIFEIFIPGVFLLLNFCFALYMTPYTSVFLKNLSSNVNEIILALVIFSFSYLLGVILRLLRAETVDRWSGSFLFLLGGNKSIKDQSLIDRFPYGNFNKNYYKCLNLSEIQEFCTRGEWKIVVNDSLPFNFIKTMLICEDEVAAKEIYAAESLSRYVAGMLYCLVISNLILLCVIELNFFINKHDLFLILACIILVWYCVIRWWCYRQYLKHCKIYRISVSTGCNLLLKKVDKVDDLVNEDRNLVIVTLDGTNNLHIRIFDAHGKRVVNKAENELMSGKMLTTLKERVKLLYEQKQKIIQNVTSISTGCNLFLTKVDKVDDLVNEGRNLVIVALVGTNLNLHIRIFDAHGKRVVDKAENELMSGKTLNEQKQKIIRNATSIAGHNLNSYYLRIFWFILRIFWFIFLFLVCGIILYGLEDKDRFIGLAFTAYLFGIGCNQSSAPPLKRL